MLRYFINNECCVIPLLYLFIFKKYGLNFTSIETARYSLVSVNVETKSTFFFYNYTILYAYM